MSIGAWLVCVAATAQTHAGELHAAAVDIEPVTLAIAGARPGDAVSGDLRLPRGSPGRVPAVLILHSSPGYDGRGTFYAEALNRAGIATLEIDYLRGKGIPPTPRDNLPHVFQTLRHLTGHARIDPARVGVLGFSWGGILAVLASSSDLARAYGDGRQFAAHVGLYPICWQHHAIAAGRSNWFGRNIYARVTGRPVLILAGGQDAFDDPDSCQRFVAALRPQARANFSVTTYPTATFGWDSRFGSATYDSGVNKGRGGINTIVADPKVAEQSRKDVVALFATALSTAPR